MISTAYAHDVATVPEGVGQGGALWNMDLLQVGLPLALAAGLYAAGIYRLWQRSGVGHGVRVSQAMSFAGGWLALAIALLSPIDTLGSELFTVHMIQHEVLMLLAAPFLVLGRPLPVFLWAFAPGVRAVLGHVGQAAPVKAFWRGLNQPLTGWLLHAVALWAWHAPVLFDAALRSRGIHDLQHISFFVTALIFWSALLHARARESQGAAILYLFTTTVHTGVLGALITFASRPWYESYLETAHHWGLTPLEDQQLGGLIMWVPGAAVYIVFALILLARWVSASDRTVVRYVP